MGTGARTEDKPNVPRWLSPFSHHSLWTPGYAAEVRRADVRVREVFMSSSEGAAEQIKPVVIGAGPAGLTAAYEFGKRGVTSTVLEATDTVGGISQTAERDGWRFDIGGHRFFTKVEEVEALWHEILPDEDFLLRPRMSRIYYKDKFYDYPLRATNALRNLGPIEAVRCVLSYGWARIRPPKNQEVALLFDFYFVPK